jgi:hypothetical protein
MTRSHSERWSEHERSKLDEAALAQSDRAHGAEPATNGGRAELTEKASRMTALKNTRWESFAQGRASGLPAYKAYLEAGYKCSVETAFANSSKLLRNAKVAGRIRELIEELSEKLMVTRESLCMEFDQAIALAHAQGQPAAAAGAIASKQKLMGLDPMSKSLNVNVSGSFNALTEDELGFELASMINEVRAAAGKGPVALPHRAASVAQAVAPPGKKH